jgi:DNA-binding transcriptional ArsR family regulator
LSNLLNALAHPHRIRIIEELRDREMDVNSIQQILGTSHSSVSQNLSVLRAHRLVRERREGRRVIYSLRQPDLAPWLLDGLKFLESDLTVTDQIRGAVESARSAWGRNSRASAPGDQGS